MKDTQQDLQSREQAKVLDQGHTLEQRDAYFYFDRGNIRYTRKDFRGAAAEYFCALRRSPFFAEAAINLGNAYYQLKNYQKSLVWYEHAASLTSENVHVCYNRGNALAAVSRLSEAVEAFSRAIELLPVFAGSYLNRGHAFSRLMRHPEALADYDQALILAPSDSNIAWTTTWAHFSKGTLSGESVQELERVSCLEPSHYTSQLCLAVMALHRLDTQASLAHLEQAIQQEPDEWDPHFWIGMVSAMQGETEIARQSIEHAIELGLPPLLLTPLSWLQPSRPDFFESYGRDLLQRIGI